MLSSKLVQERVQQEHLDSSYNWNIFDVSRYLSSTSRMFQTLRLHFPGASPRPRGQSATFKVQGAGATLRCGLACGSTQLNICSGKIQKNGNMYNIYIYIYTLSSSVFLETLRKKQCWSGDSSTLPSVQVALRGPARAGAAQKGRLLGVLQSG